MTTHTSGGLLTESVSETQAAAIVESLGRLYSVACIYPLLHPRVQSAGNDMAKALEEPLHANGAVRIGMVQDEVSIDGHQLALEGGAERLFRNLDLLAIDGLEIQSGATVEDLLSLVGCVQQAIRDSALDRWDMHAWLPTLPERVTCLARQYAHLGTRGAPKSLDRNTRRRLIRDSLKPMHGIVMDRTAETMLHRFLEQVFDSAGRHVDDQQKNDKPMSENEREDLFALMVEGVQRMLRQKVDEGVESLQLDDLFDDCMRTLAAQCDESTAQALMDPLRSQARDTLMGAFSNEVPLVASRARNRVERRTVLVDDLMDGLDRFLAEPHVPCHFRDQPLDTWETACIVLEYLREDPKCCDWSKRLVEVLGDRRLEERQDELLQVGRALAENGDLRALDKFLAAVATVSRHQVSPFHRNLLRRLLKEAGVEPDVVWPHLVQVLLFDDGTDTGERNWLLKELEQVSSVQQAAERHRFNELLGRRDVDRPLVDVPTRELALVPAFECILEHPMLERAHDSLIRALVNQPPPIPAAPAFQAVDPLDMAGRRFVAAALREGAEGRPSEGLRRKGVKMVLQRLRMIEDDERGLARALTLIDALGWLGGDEAVRGLQEIRDERRGLFKVWPKESRRMADQALKRIRQGSS